MHSLANSLVVVVAVQDPVVRRHLHLGLLEARLDDIQVGGETRRRTGETFRDKNM